MEACEKNGYFHVKTSQELIDFVKSNYKSKIKYIISRGAHFEYTEEILSKFPNLKYILLAQIGNDNVDLNYCQQKEIEVINFISEKSIYPAAEQTIASLIGGMRQIFTTGCNIKNGKYSRKMLGKNLENFTIGVMGTGRIGGKVIKLLKVFPCKVITYDVIFKLKEKQYWIIKLENSLKSIGVKTYSNLDLFLKEADYVVLYIPGFKENLGLLNYSKLKNINGLVNMSRAGIVVEEDILKLLNEGKLEFYVSDVVNKEPYIEKINKPLITHPNVFITPHIGANTYQVQADVIEKIFKYLDDIIGK